MSQNVVKNPQAASEALNTPIEIIKLCINRGAPGCNANATINIRKLKNYIDENKTNLEAEAADSLMYWKKENAKIDNELKKLEKKERQRQIIEPKEVKQLLVALSTTISAIANGYMNELPPKLAGKNEADIKLILDKAITDMLKSIKDKETKYSDNSESEE